MCHSECQQNQQPVLALHLHPTKGDVERSTVRKKVLIALPLEKYVFTSIRIYEEDIHTTFFPPPGSKV